MSTLTPALVRVVAIGLVLAAYSLAVWLLASDPSGGANIGAGLLAFGGLALIGLVWGFLDARRRGLASSVVLWVVVGLVTSAGWLVVATVLGNDGSVRVGEQLAADAFLVPFVGGMIAFPAAIGAVVGAAGLRS